ncbi:hypothetical protein [Paracoccus sp. Ld10]|uniref:hypothetical protein n=1 Tax=Paracoccus sp. Ld10 TaxID=649158 RepID=UPI00386CF150
MMPLPRAPDRLPDEMATALGHAVAAFGFLEEALKRAIFSLTRKGLGHDAQDDALHAWLRRMEEIADDSLGTLIDSFLAAARRGDAVGGDGADVGPLPKTLPDLRRLRNLLCHASWRPGAQPGLWHPTFINTRGQRHPHDMSADDVLQIRDRTLAAARQVVGVMRQTGIDGEWAGTDA